jgi:division protein CdvB (Snf7/Vps24/ESCRT-III family)
MIDYKTTLIELDKAIARLELVRAKLKELDNQQDIEINDMAENYKKSYIGLEIEKITKLNDKLGDLIK